MEMDNGISPSANSGNRDGPGKAVVGLFTAPAYLRRSGSRGYGHGAGAEQNDKGRNA